MQNIESLLGVAGSSGERDQSVVFWIAPMRVVVTVASGPDVQKGYRIHIVANPPVSANIEIDLVHRILKDLPLLVFQADNDVELRLPHLLNGFRNSPIAFQRLN